MGTVMVPIPTFTASLYALAVGIIIPILSSLYPMKIVLSETLTDALDYARSKTKAVFIEIVKAKDFDKKPYIIFGLIAVIYGLAIYYFLPLSLVSLNFSLLLTIFFLILIAMFVGLVLLALNLQRLLEIIMVYLFLFYEKPSTRLLVLKNLIAHKPRNRMTVCIYAMSVGFLIMILVSYNLEINNAQALSRLNEGTYMHLELPRTSTVTPNEFEPFLLPVADLVEFHSYETHQIDLWYFYIGLNELFVSDDLALVQLPVSVLGVSPYNTQTLIQDYIKMYQSNGTTDLSLSEQLYTARGMQGAGMGGFTSKSLSLDPDDYTQTYKINMFTENWNVFTRNRCMWSTSVMPGKQMTDRETSQSTSMLISLPLMKKLMGLTTSIPNFPFERVVIKLKEEGNEDHIAQVKKQLNLLSQRKNAEVYDYNDAQGAFDDAASILDIIFNVIIISVMFLCFFSLSSSMTANMLEQKKEIGVMRAIGMRKARIYFLYMYE